jgi:hypothetical protein
MDLLDLIRRSPIAQKPVSLAVRPGRDPAPPLEAARRALALLRLRGKPDEILLFAPPGAAVDLPARIDGVRLRLAPLPRGDARRCLAEAVPRTTRPILVVADDRLAIRPDELETFLNRLDHADLVVAVRPRTGLVRWMLWPLERLLRAILGVPVADPTAPVKALRRAAVEGIVLETEGPVEDVELIAKLTYLVSLIDEAPVADPWRPPGLLSAFARQSAASWRAWRRPTFCRSSLTGEPARRDLRPPPEDAPAPNLLLPRPSATHASPPRRPSRTHLLRPLPTPLARRPLGQFPRK